MLRRLMFLAFLIIAPAMLAPPVAAQDFQKGSEAYERGDYATALKQWLPLAEDGHARAQHDIGRMYFRGHGLSRNAVKAYMWVYLAGAQEEEWKSHLGTLAASMTPDQITEAQRLAREWLKKR